MKYYFHVPRNKTIKSTLLRGIQWQDHTFLNAFIFNLFSRRMTTFRKSTLSTVSFGNIRKNFAILVDILAMYFGWLWDFLPQWLVDFWTQLWIWLYFLNTRRSTTLLGLLSLGYRMGAIAISIIEYNNTWMNEIRDFELRDYTPPVCHRQSFITLWWCEWVHGGTGS